MYNLIQGDIFTFKWMNKWFTSRKDILIFILIGLKQINYTKINTLFTQSQREWGKWKRKEEPNQQSFHHRQLINSDFLCIWLCIIIMTHFGWTRLYWFWTSKPQTLSYAWFQLLSYSLQLFFCKKCLCDFPKAMRQFLNI